MNRRYASPRPTFGLTRDSISGCATGRCPFAPDTAAIGASMQRSSAAYRRFPAGAARDRGPFVLTPAMPAPPAPSRGMRSAQGPAIGALPAVGPMLGTLGTYGHQIMNALAAPLAHAFAALVPQAPLTQSLNTQRAQTTPTGPMQLPASVITNTVTNISAKQQSAAVGDFVAIDTTGHATVDRYVVMQVTAADALTVQGPFVGSWSGTSGALPAWWAPSLPPESLPPFTVSRSQIAEIFPPSSRSSADARNTPPITSNNIGDSAQVGDLIYVPTSSIPQATLPSWLPPAVGYAIMRVESATSFVLQGAIVAYQMQQDQGPIPLLPGTGSQPIQVPRSSVVMVIRSGERVLPPPSRGMSSARERPMQVPISNQPSVGAVLPPILQGGIPLPATPHPTLHPNPLPAETQERPTTTMTYAQNQMQVLGKYHEYRAALVDLLSRGQGLTGATMDEIDTATAWANTIAEDLKRYNKPAEARDLQDLVGQVYVLRLVPAACRAPQGFCTPVNMPPWTAGSNLSSVTRIPNGTAVRILEEPPAPAGYERYALVTYPTENQRDVRVWIRSSDLAR